MEHTPRLATPRDLRAAEAIVRAAFTSHVARIGRKPGPMGDDYNALIAACRVHVVAHDGVVRGAQVLMPEGGVMLLDNVAVAPAAGPGAWPRANGFRRTGRQGLGLPRHTALHQ